MDPGISTDAYNGISLGGVGLNSLSAFKYWKCLPMPRRLSFRRYLSVCQ